MKTLTVTIPGCPLSKKRHRTVPLLQCGQCGSRMNGQYKDCPKCGGPMRFLTNKSYSDSETVKYENLVAYCAHQAMRKQEVEMFTGPVRLTLTLYFPMAASRICTGNHDPAQPKFKERSTCKKLHAGDWHTQKPDRSNVEKAIEDGMIEKVFPDDCIICDGRIQKFWGAEGRAEILVEEL